MKDLLISIGYAVATFVIFFGGVWFGLTHYPDCPEAPEVVDTVMVDTWCVRVNGVVYAEQCYGDSLQADSIYRELGASLNEPWKKFELGGVIFSNQTYDRVTINPQPTEVEK